jgi:hypothetical protein
VPQVRIDTPYIKGIRTSLPVFIFGYQDKRIAGLWGGAIRSAPLFKESTMKSRITHIEHTRSLWGTSIVVSRGTKSKIYSCTDEIRHISSASHWRIQTITHGSLAKLVRPVDMLTISSFIYEIEPVQDYGSGVRILKNGNMMLTATPRERVEMRREARKDVGDGYSYHHMNYIMWELFNDDLVYYEDASESGIAMFSGPVILDKAYFNEDDPRYNEDDDDLGCDWENTKAWYYNDYCYRHPVEELINKGYVIFNRVDD